MELFLLAFFFFFLQLLLVQSLQFIKHTFFFTSYILRMNNYPYNHYYNRTANRRPVHILYCTGNAGKFAEASIIVNNWVVENDGVVDIRLIQADPDPTEVQGNERQIAIQKCVSAYESVKYTGALTIDIDFVITEDVGLRLDCLNGFPGPYCKPMLETIGVEGLANLVLKYDEEKGERNATATCSLAVLETSIAYKFPLFVEKCVHIFEGTVAGKIVEPRGNVQHGKASWNACFQVAANNETDGATFGELSYEEQSKISHRKKAIERFLNSPLVLGRLS